VASRVVLSSIELVSSSFYVDLKLSWFPFFEDVAVSPIGRSWNGTLTGGNDVYHFQRVFQILAFAWCLNKLFITLIFGLCILLRHISVFITCLKGSFSARSPHFLASGLCCDNGCPTRDSTFRGKYQKMTYSSVLYVRWASWEPHYAAVSGVECGTDWVWAAPRRLNVEFGGVGGDCGWYWQACLKVMSVPQKERRDWSGNINERTGERSVKYTKKKNQ
jgi:hypothetical protein